MRIALLFACILVVPVLAADSLPWRGRIVFDARVRVDDAPGLTGHPATHPQTIMDDNWDLYSVWADDRDGDGEFDVFFAVSRDTGRTWSVPNANLSQDPSQYYLFPWLAVDETGLYVVWQSWTVGAWRLMFTRSTDGGTSWTTPGEVPGITVVNDLHSGINFGPQPKLAVDSRSCPDSTFLYLLWADNATGKIQMNLARSTDLGTSFTGLGIVDNNLDNVNRHPYIAVDDSGRVHCAWARGTSGSNNDPHCWIGYSRSTDRGSTFLGTDLIANDDLTEVYRGNPSITCDEMTGNVLVSWEDSRRAGGNSNPDIWFSWTHPDSAGFVPNQRVNWWAGDTGARYDNYKPVIRMDPVGVAVAAWHDDPEKDNSYGIHLAAYTDSAGCFSTSKSLVETYTGTGGGNFGNDFYPPSLFVRAVIDPVLHDTTTHFFVVWQDFTEDAVGGNIYSIHGRVVTRPPWPYGWHEIKPPVPAAPSTKPVRAGGWLAMDQASGLILIAKGNKVADFYAYDPLDSTPAAWTTVTPWPEGTEGKPPYKGACAVSDDAGHIYATKGRNSFGFWRYDVGTDVWTQLADVPEGNSEKKVKGGTDMAYVVEDGTPYIYLLKGYKTDFLRYDILHNTWDTMPDAPLGIKPKWDKGSWLVYDGNHTIYAHKAKVSEMWPFDLLTHTWGEQLPGIPLPSLLTDKNKKSRDGSAGVWYDGYIYALKGGNTCEFWRYNTATGTWSEKDTMPSNGSTGKKKRVKAGGDLVSYGYWWAFFALKGNKTLELWRYVDSAPRAQALPPERGSAQARPLDGRLSSFAITPTVVTEGHAVATVAAPDGEAWLSVFDVTGRQVISRLAFGRSTAVLDLRSLSAGIYLVRLEVGGASVVRKLTIE